MSDGTLPWRALWDETASLLGDRTVARWLCEEASGAEAGALLDEIDEPATERMVAHLDAMVARVRAGEPVQYVLGHWSFRRLDLMVDRRVLIPRPETEWVVERAIDIARAMPKPLRVADLGTGSGAIGLALAAELRHDDMEVWLTDASADALDVARANLAGIGRAASQVRIAQGSWCDALPDDQRRSFDLIVSNPPYVATADDVERVVRDWEPASALFAGDDGLDDIRIIAASSMEWLRPGGVLVIEIGSGQGETVSALLTAAGYVDVAVFPDLAGHDRAARATAP